MQPTLFSDQPLFLPLISILMIWSMVWKGIALWKSARAGSRVWFVVLLIVNTVGILEILYIYIFSKMQKKQSTTTV
jgi:hypothetical protein